MDGRLLVIPTVLIALFGFNQAYAYSIDVSVTVLDYDGNNASIQLQWNDDVEVNQYKVGCVSCMPNLSKFTGDGTITFDNITPFPNTSNAMLYLVAYDSEDEIIDAQQILVDLSN